jgi:hypothetical protein
MAKIIHTIVIIIILVGAVFGWWGMFHPAGQKHFDEMDGMIPFFALCFSGVTGSVYVIVMIVRKALTRND